MMFFVFRYYSIKAGDPGLTETEVQLRMFWLD
jgi:hypothetical protein